jgi:hypothetical protein
MSGTPCQVQRPAPLMGADTEKVLSAVLGLADAEIFYFLFFSFLTLFSIFLFSIFFSKGTGEQ